MPISGSNGVPFGSDPDAIVQGHNDARRLDRVLAFCGLELSDVLGSVVEARRVEFYLSLDQEMTRRQHVLDLEKQWNPHGLLR